MQIETWPIDRPTPYPNNPRVNDAAAEAVAKSIRAFGFKVPILVDGDGVIVAGHTRLKAARSLGLTEVPVIVAADLTPEQARALRIADNQTGNIAEWDMDRLCVELRILSDLGCELDVLGFGDELDAMLAVAGEPDEPEDTDDGADDAPATPREAKSRPGEVYVLGRHRLMCGDSTLAADIARLMGGGQVDLLLTDPPYNVAIVGGTADALTIENDDMSPEEFAEFLEAAFLAADSAMRPGASVYIWLADRTMEQFLDACAAARWDIVQCLVWAKGAMVLGRCDYHWRHEPCLYGSKPGGMRAWHGEGSPGTVLSYKKPARNGEHPTMKPVDLFAFQMANSCPSGGAVLDPFGGSGTTIIAAERLGMRARLMELSPNYADVIRKR
jgi:site-specific DNA-methyltransferase (adenine-specific)